MQPEEPKRIYPKRQPTAKDLLAERCSVRLTALAQEYFYPSVFVVYTSPHGVEVLARPMDPESELCEPKNVWIRKRLLHLTGHAEKAGLLEIHGPDQEASLLEPGTFTWLRKGENPTEEQALRFCSLDDLDKMLTAAGIPQNPVLTTTDPDSKKAASR